MSQEPWTVLRLLEWTTDFFRKHGSDSPRLDAEVLLAHARECSRMELYTAFNEEPAEPQRVAFRELVRRRGEGVPVAQLVGFKEFYSLKFRVDEHVLIPRPETEHLVVEALDLCKSDFAGTDPIRIADVGTGSGAIAVALAKHADKAKLTAIDISEPALEIARWNATHHEVDDRIEFVQGDLLDALDDQAAFELICSNPPYVSEDEYEELSESVRLYEPVEALVSGPTGTETIQRLIDQASVRLVSGGALLIELSPMIATRCLEMLQSSDGFTDARLVKDLAGHQRLLVGRRR
ncbi:peptide chain release factor N(5)-glutamine methyltransferase [Crateriforma spongiae]|uniref:peptide chain release factor N(5)-glutamine methyltransferase n=1 Tax=Crateriforma spongiae TaxID=2724528 RepID=UPI001445B6F2|nr:peptide chain release factor N(5)-glutamine methyltransferase [Crateriforma spongiae]